MSTAKNVSKAELHAFVDGQLDTERHREVASHLSENPEAAARVAAYEKQKQALRTLFNPVLDEALPEALIPKPPAPRRVHLLWAAASIVLFVAGGLVGWQAQQFTQESHKPVFTVAQGAAVAHKVFTPQLGDLGFSLVGGRLLSADKGPAAQFMYQDANRRRITLYVITDGDWQTKAEFQFTQQGPVGVFYWISGRVGYGLTAEMPRPELLKIARTVYDQLQP